MELSVDPNTNSTSLLLLSLLLLLQHMDLTKLLLLLLLLISTDAKCSRGSLFSDPISLTRQTLQQQQQK